MSLLPVGNVRQPFLTSANDDCVVSRSLTQVPCMRILALKHAHTHHTHTHTHTHAHTHADKLNYPVYWMEQRWFLRTAQEHGEHHAEGHGLLLEGERGDGAPPLSAPRQPAVFP